MQELISSLFDSTFNGVDVVWLAFVAGMAIFARYAILRGHVEQKAAAAAIERARAQAHPLDASRFPLDPELAQARQVRRSYDGLPYRRGRAAVR